ncbi:MAG: hypothetical protein ACW98K_13250 [Candidatus Kariarchaeaceae archaeon]
MTGTTDLISLIIPPLPFALNLKSVYNSYFIDPQTKYFDFSNSVMIGYISSYLLFNRANLIEYKLGHDLIKNNAVDLLLNSSFDTYNNLGIQVIETDINIDIDRLEKYAGGFGYELISDEHLVATLSIEDIRTSFTSSEVEVLDVDLELGREELISYILSKENFSKATLIKFFNFLNEDKERLISHKIAQINNRIIGHGLLIRSRWDTKIAMLSFFHASDDFPQATNVIMDSILNNAKQREIEAIQVHLRDDVNDFESIYSKFGFMFNKIITFQKLN